jgi:hypothetical protein
MYTAKATGAFVGMNLILLRLQIPEPCSWFGLSVPTQGGKFQLFFALSKMHESGTFIESIFNLLWYDRHALQLGRFISYSGQRREGEVYIHSWMKVKYTFIHRMRKYTFILNEKEKLPHS